MKYLIASGWWSCATEDDQREKLLGDDTIRDVEFHKTWRKCIDRFANAEEIIIIDSASPRKPEELEGEKWLSMCKNFGHSTNHTGQFSGVARSMLLSMMYAYLNDYDYWVYIEQDALIYGEDIIERCIGETKKGVAFGCGRGTPQEIQQSLMIFHRSKIIDFISNYIAIQEKDKIISPEWKFLLSQNSMAKVLPVSMLKWLTRSSRYEAINRIRSIAIKYLRLFDQFNVLSIGFGRVRPIDFSDSHFYFQHGSSDELSIFMEKIRE